MATIDLGKIKLVYRGAYNNSTAYTVDDVVQHTDSGLTSSFICTTNSTGNAPSTSGTVHGSWSYLAKGAAGSVLTTQGDILYRDGSGDQRLAKGTAGQVLKINSGATAPEWGTDSGGGLLQFKQTVKKGTQTISSASGVAITDTEVSLTPSSASNKILVRAVTSYGGNSNLYESGKLYRKIGGGSYAVVSDAIGDADGSATRSTFPLQLVSGANSQWKTHTSAFEFLDTPNTTSQVYYQLYAGYNNDNLRINEEENSSNGSYDSRPLTTISISELSSTIL